MDNGEANDVVVSRGLVRLGYCICLVSYALNITMIVQLPAAMVEDYEDSTVPAAYATFLALCVVMLIFSAVLLVGLVQEQVNCFYPWLIFAAVTVVVGTMCVILFGRHRMGAISTVVLIITALSWYPIFYIYQKYRLKSTLIRRQQAPVEMQALNRPAPTAPYLIDNEVSCTKATGGAPPTYDEVIASNVPYPYEGCRDDSVTLGWNIPGKK